MNLINIVGYGLLACMLIVLIVSIVLFIIGMKQSKAYEDQALPILPVIEDSDEVGRGGEDSLGVISKDEITNETVEEPEEESLPDIIDADDNDEEMSSDELFHDEETKISIDIPVEHQRVSNPFESLKPTAHDNDDTTLSKINDLLSIDDIQPRINVEPDESSMDSGFKYDDNDHTKGIS
jgi:hypothetical protein